LIAGSTFIGQLPLYQFRVAFTDNVAVNPASISAGNVTVTAPNGTSIPVQLTAVLAHGVVQYVATYQVPAPTQVGTYTVTLQPNQINDLAGNFTPGQGLGSFIVTAAQMPVATGPAPDLTPQIVSTLPGAVVAGAKGWVRLKVANIGTAPIHAPVQISLFASPDSVLDGNATLLGQPVVNLKVPVRKSKTATLRFNYPQFLAAGAYYLLADVNSDRIVPERNFANNLAIASSTVVIAPAFVDLAASFPPHKAATFRVGGIGVASVTVANLGNVAATRSLTIDLSAISASTMPTPTGTLIAFRPNINLRPGRSQTFKIRVPLSGLSAGSYNFVADVDPANTFNESTLTNNMATDLRLFTIK